MSMTIGNNMGISSSYNAGKTDGHKNVREYSNYLMGKYSCLKPGNNVAVSVTPGMESGVGAKSVSVPSSSPISMIILVVAVRISVATPPI